MIKLHKNYKKINAKLKYKYMTVTMGNLVIDIPLSLPVNYAKEFPLENKYWIVGSFYLGKENDN